MKNYERDNSAFEKEVTRTQLNLQAAATCLSFYNILMNICLCNFPQKKTQDYSS